MEVRTIIGPDGVEITVFAWKSEADCVHDTGVIEQRSSWCTFGIISVVDVIILGSEHM